MASSTSNPARGVAAGLGIVKAVAADDNRDQTPALLKFQANILAVRHGLTASHARVVAELAFSNSGRQA